MYTQQEQEELARIISVFDRYIKQKDYVKLYFNAITGYTYVNYDTPGASYIIDNAAHLCKILFGEIALDVLVELTPYDLEPANAPIEIQKIIRKRIKPYLRQLPEYHYLVNELLHP